jgi:hypothetical protein
MRPNRYFDWHSAVRVLLSIIVVTAFASAARPGDEKTPKPDKAPALLPTTVGLPGQLKQVVLPGTELEAKPWADKSPVMVQIEAVYPHGSDFRYDIVYQGLEPGEFDLRDYLRRKDASSTANLPPLVFKVSTVLPPGQVEPNAPSFAALPWLGAYRLMLGAVAVVWLAAMIWVLYPRRRLKGATAANELRPTSLADRLRPLVAQAKAGEVEPAQLAQLERALVTYWRRKLSMREMPLAQAISELRKHADAGPLISQLEAWLHRPSGNSAVDVNALLTPYENLPADEFDRISAEADRESLAGTP